MDIKEELSTTYKECDFAQLFGPHPSRGKLELVERLAGHCAKPVQTASGPRLHHTPTGCSTDTTEKADVCKHQAECQKHVYEETFAVGRLSPEEQQLPETAQMVYLHHDKGINVLTEVWHHFKAGLVFAISSSPDLCISIIKKGIKGVIACRNPKQMDLLKSLTLHWLELGDSTNILFPGYLSRRAIVKKLGLGPDAPPKASSGKLQKQMEMTSFIRLKLFQLAMLAPAI